MMTMIRLYCSLCGVNNLTANTLSTALHNINCANNGERGYPEPPPNHLVFGPAANARSAADEYRARIIYEVSLDGND